MIVTCLSLPELKLIQPRIFKDERGLFWESYHQPHFTELGVAVHFVQDNCSVSRQDTIRGLHVQPKQAKLISVIHGRICDVAVDIRPASATFGQYAAIVLDDKERRQLFIPDGFAHGFCVLSEMAIVQYKVSEVYNPKTERAIRWNDPALAIDWPCKTPILSEKDRSSPFLNEMEWA